ncbi:MAG: hypothetical protein Q7V14_03815 [Coriobacteriia bacterium]|nr:hypothetical protein [Coriobacteriia bacterium]MDO9107369.1 hypothetical protein [Coriobacteriia bacterium]
MTATASQGIDPVNAALVMFYAVIVVLLIKADRADLFATWIHKLRIRLGRPVPVGAHVVCDGVSCRVGRPDNTMIFRLPLRFSGDGPPTIHTGVTDDATRFTVSGTAVELDEFLEAYDDRLGTIEIEVYEPGKIASIGIGAATNPRHFRSAR